MILQALKEYYDRKVADPDSDIAPEGFEKKPLPFIVVIDAGGSLINLEDTRENTDNRLLAKEFLLPRSVGRSGGKAYATTFLLWDHIGYLFGCPEDDVKSPKQHAAWLRMLAELPEALKQDPGVSAVIRFYEKDGVEQVKGHANWKECSGLLSCNMTFRLVGDTPSTPVPCRPAVQDYVRAMLTGDQAEEQEEAGEQVMGHCLVTGLFGEIARTHGRTPINKDTKSLVSFQKGSGYDSYGKQQCFNAPIGKSAEFAYVTGLNTLLRSKRQRIQVADATTVFWSAKNTRFESDALFFFGELRKDDPDHDTEAVRAVYASIWNGTYLLPEDETTFYVLGLAPNAARISVRFWKEATVREIGKRLMQHVQDLNITHGSLHDPLPLWRLLRSIAVQDEDKNIPPNIAGDTMRAILAGTPYPQTLLQAAVRRIRAEHDITYPRAALIKACLNRSLRFNNATNERELAVSLDESSTNTGYLLGRLFATLEKIQDESSPGLNATIRDRFYGAASGTPMTVFPNLMRLKNHHLAKLDNTGRRVNFERLIGQIIADINDFPPHLCLADQGRFAIGYYHQTQAFYTKKNDICE